MYWWREEDIKEMRREKRKETIAKEKDREGRNEFLNKHNFNFEIYSDPEYIFMQHILHTLLVDKLSTSPCISNASY